MFLEHIYVASDVSFSIRENRGKRYVKISQCSRRAKCNR